MNEKIITRVSNFKVTNSDKMYNSDQKFLRLSFSQLLIDKNFNLTIGIVIIKFSLFDLEKNHFIILHWSIRKFIYVINSNYV